MGDIKQYRLLRNRTWGLPGTCLDMNIIAGLSNINKLWDHESDRSGRCRPDSCPRHHVLTHRRHAAARSGTKFKAGETVHGLAFLLVSAASKLP